MHNMVFLENLQTLVILFLALTFTANMIEKKTYVTYWKWSLQINLQYKANYILNVYRNTFSLGWIYSSNPCFTATGEMGKYNYWNRCKLICKSNGNCD